MSSLTGTSRDEAVISLIESLSLSFEERAEATDQGGPLNQLLRENIQQLIDIGYLGSGIDTKYGGLGLSHETNIVTLKRISSACGVTAFTQQQLHAGGNFLSKSEDEDLRAELLPQFASGTNICGVGFSHLRRLGPPAVKAVRAASGFTISGVLPWISAWSMLDSFILGATVNDGNMIYCYLPISEFRSALFPSPPMEISTLEASETIQLNIDHIEMPARYVLSEHDSQHMVRFDYRGITGHTELPLGCALGSARFLSALYKKNGRDVILRTAEKIEKLAATISDDVVTWNGTRFEEPAYFVNALKTRTAAITLAINAAAAGISAAGGSAHLTTSPGQRRFRESAFYATQAQTLTIQESLLEAFIHG